MQVVIVVVGFLTIFLGFAFRILFGINGTSSVTMRRNSFGSFGLLGNPVLVFAMFGIILLLVGFLIP
jgi:hypothetical protein